MPNQLALVTSGQKVTHDPTITINGDPMSFVGDNPYGVMTEEIIFGSVNQLLGWIDDATGLDLLTFATSLENLLFPAHPTTLPDLLSGLFGWLTPNTSGSTGIWGDGIFGQGVPAFSLTGTAPTNIFDVLPIGALSSLVSPNLFSNPIFDLSTPFFGGDDWSLDTTTNSPESNAGSAMVTADGGPHELYSNSISVAAGQQVSLNISAMASGLTATGTPIQLLIEQYLKGVLLDNNPVTIDSIAAGPTAFDWQDMTGTYTTPHGVDEIKTVLHVDPTATAGVIHFSAGHWSKSIVSELIPGEWVQGFTDGFNTLDNFFQQGLDTIHNAIDGGSALNVYLTDVFGQIDDWWNDTQTTAGQASDAYGGLSDAITAMTTGWQQQAQATWSFPGLDTLYGNAFDKSSEVTNIAAGLAQLKAQQTAQQNYGKSFLVTVSDYGTSIPSVFTKLIDTGSGALSNDGDTLEYTGGNGTEGYLYNVDVLATDYFETSVVIPRKTAEWLLSGGNNFIYLVGRSNAAMTSFCFVQIGYHTVRFGCVRAGISTLASPDWFAAAANFDLGGYVTFQGGTGADNNFFQVLQNNKIITGQDDSGNISNMGALYRSVGFAVQGESEPNGILVGNISNFLGNDNTPAPVPGSGATINKLSGSVSLSSGNNKFPSTMYPNTLADKSSDITVTGNSFQVTNAGRYIVTVAFGFASVYGSQAGVLIYKNAGSNPILVGQQAYNSQNFCSSFPITLAAGDTIIGGYYTGTGGTAIGESTGAYTWMGIVRVDT